MIAAVEVDTMTARTMSRRRRGAIRTSYRRHVLTQAEYAMGDEGVPPRDVRLARLRRLLPATAREIVEAYPDAWDLERDGQTRLAGSRRLERDLSAVGAVCVGRVWTLPEAS